MKRFVINIILISSVFSQRPDPFSIDIRPRIIDNSKILVNIEILNHVGRPLDYLEGFIAEYSNKGEFLNEKRMVLVYSYEPPLQTGYSTTKTMIFDTIPEKPHKYEFTISKVKFVGESRVFAWHPKSGFIRID